MNSTIVMNVEPSSKSIMADGKGFPLNITVIMGFNFAFTALVCNILLFPACHRSVQGLTDLMQSPLVLMKITIAVAGIIVSMSYFLEASSVAYTSWTLCEERFKMLEFPKYFHPFFLATNVLAQALYLSVKVVKRCPPKSHWCLTWMLALVPWFMTIFLVSPFTFNDLQMDFTHCWTRVHWTADQWMPVYLLAWIIPLCFVSLASILIFIVRFLVNKPKAQIKYKPLPELMAGHREIDVKQGKENVPRVFGESFLQLPSQMTVESHEQSCGNDGWQVSDSPTTLKEIEQVGRLGKSTRSITIPERTIPPATSTTYWDFARPFASLQCVSLVFIVSVLPHASYSMYLTSQPEMTNQMLAQVFRWLMHVYPCVVPLIWLRDFGHGHGAKNSRV